MLRIKNLSKKYRNARQAALEGVSFSVLPGSFTALLGQNGAGKSTLIGILTDTVKPDAGSVTINGFPLRLRNPATKLALGIVPQEISFDYLFTVEETLVLQAGYFGLRRNQDWIQTLLQRLSLWDKRREQVKNLSGGMKRRLMIAKALVHRPRLLLLDEPTAGVDVALRRQLHEFLREMNRDGLTIVLTSHYLEEAEQLCDHVVLLHRGKVLADAPRDEFLSLSGDRFSARIVTHCPERLQLAFQSLDLVANKEDDNILHISVPRSMREHFLASLGKHAADVIDIRINEPHLEEVFLKLTSTEEKEPLYEAVA
jgi:ABC-2 type transport system ATP-binding protein